MQFLIKSFFDSENRQSIEFSNYLLVIQDNCLIMKVSNKSFRSSDFLELYRKSLAGWHNIYFNGNNYVMDSNKYISIESDILTQHYSKYQIEHFSLSFIPRQIYQLDKFFNYLNELNKKGLSEEQFQIVEQLKSQELEAKRREEEMIRQEEERKRKIEIERKRAEQLKRRGYIKNLISIVNKVKEERQKYVNDFISMINRIREDRELEKIFFNYFKRYVGKTLLGQGYYTSFMNYLLKNNYVYENVKINIPILRKITLDYSANKNYYKLVQIDKLIEFMVRRTMDSNNECAKLLTWIEISDVAMAYYSNCFYEQYGKQLGNIDSLNLNDSVLTYIHSDILYDEEEIRNMFVYFLMSLNKFEEVDANMGYLYCRKIFNDIYDKLKNENEYDSFISSLLLNEQEDKKVYTIDDIDLMAGNEFEIFVGELFKKMGYKTIITKASGDQGIDVISEKNGIRYGIQSKCYSKVVSNSAIQEVVAGISFYKCDKAIVITNNYFTNSAIELAKANKVVLWDREMLKLKIRDLFS